MRDMTIVESPTYDSVTITPNVTIDHLDLSGSPRRDTFHNKNANGILEDTGYKRAHSVEIVLPPAQSRWHFTRLKGVERWGSIKNFIHGFLNLLADITEWFADCLETFNELSPACSELNCDKSESGCDYCDGLICDDFNTY